MKRSILLSVGSLIMAAAQPAAAQVFDMGTLTGTLSQDAVTQHEERRSGTGRYAPRARSAQARSNAQNCALLPKFKRKFGPNHPDSRRFAALCRSLGY